MVGNDTEVDELKRAKETAIRLLARREHAQSELYRKLSERGYPREIISTVLEELAQRKLQSDDRFAEAYTRMRMQRGYGPLRIKLELKERGVASELIERYLSLSKDEWMNHLKTVSKKRFGEISPQTVEERARQFRFLQYRGFDLMDIQKLFRD